MDFDLTNGIYNYYLEKKEKKEEILYVVETSKQDYIVNRQTVALMLVCPLSPAQLLSFNLAEVRGEDVRDKDYKQITYLALNKSGYDFYKTMEVEQRSMAFFIALSQLNNEEKPRRYKQERKRITSYCLKNGIKNIDRTTATVSKAKNREL